MFSRTKREVQFGEVIVKEEIGAIVGISVDDKKLRLLITEVSIWHKRKEGRKIRPSRIIKQNYIVKSCFKKD